MKKIILFLLSALGVLTSCNREMVPLRALRVAVKTS